MHIYHITEESTWKEANESGVYLPSGFDKDGFIHCSTEDQVLPVAENFYRSKNGLVLLKIDPSRLTSPLVFENLEGNAELFPHLYGSLPVAAVVESLPFIRGQDGRFRFPSFS